MWIHRHPLFVSLSIFLSRQTLCSTTNSHGWSLHASLIFILQSLLRLAQHDVTTTDIKLLTTFHSTLNTTMSHVHHCTDLLNSVTMNCVSSEASYVLSNWQLSSFNINVGNRSYSVDTCNIESIRKPEETIYNIRLFMKVIRTVWKLIIMTLWPVSITTSSLGWQQWIQAVQCSGDWILVNKSRIAEFSNSCTSKTWLVKP